MYLKCLHCSRSWATCGCSHYVQEEALFRAERRDGYRYESGQLTPAGVALYAQIEALQRAAKNGWLYF